MLEKKKDDKEIDPEKGSEYDFWFEPEGSLMEIEKMSAEEKKEYLEFLWRRRFFSC